MFYQTQVVIIYFNNNFMTFSKINLQNLYTYFYKKIVFRQVIYIRELYKFKIQGMSLNLINLSQLLNNDLI